LNPGLNHNPLPIEWARTNEVKTRVSNKQSHDSFEVQFEDREAGQRGQHTPQFVYEAEVFTAELLTKSEVSYNPVSY
jgi:hypothetical protein